MINDILKRCRLPGASAVLALVLLGACTQHPDLPQARSGDRAEPPAYRIGPGDRLAIFVWRNTDLNIEVPVRPDGRISVPLLEDLNASGKTPTDLAREIEQNFGKFIQDPFVTVVVTDFQGTYSEQIRVVGQAVTPQAIPYRANMTLLDIMIVVGGLTEFADGNRASLARVVDGEQKVYRIRIDDLINDGDITANVDLIPGDIITIPESIF